MVAVAGAASQPAKHVTCCQKGKEQLCRIRCCKADSNILNVSKVFVRKGLHGLNALTLHASQSRQKDQVAIKFGILAQQKNGIWDKK
jgi:hypothetical protein